MRNIECVKICMLYIGTIIGAGFATGKEIIIFFGNQSVYIAILAGLSLGGVCGLFLMLGKLKSNVIISPKTKLFKLIKIADIILETLVFVCACFSFFCMCCGAEYIIFECFGIKNFGLFLGLLVAIMSVFDIKLAKNLNFVIIPIIMILIAVLLFKCDGDVTGKNNIFASLKYCCMNLLLGGYVVSEQGKDMSKRQIVTTSCICAVIFAFLMAGVYYVANQYPQAYMPTFSFAQSQNLEIIAGIIIVFAIFTTMLSCGNVIYKDLNHFVNNKILAICFLATMTIISYKWNFSISVDILYPIISYVGIIYFVIVTTHISILQSKTSLPKLQ